MTDPIIKSFAAGVTLVAGMAENAWASNKGELLTMSDYICDASKRVFADEALQQLCGIMLLAAWSDALDWAEMHSNG